MILNITNAFETKVALYSAETVFNYKSKLIKRIEFIPPHLQRIRTSKPKIKVR